MIWPPVGRTSSPETGKLKFLVKSFIYYSSLADFRTTDLTHPPKKGEERVTINDYKTLSQLAGPNRNPDAVYNFLNGGLIDPVRPLTHIMFGLSLFCRDTCALTAI